METSASETIRIIYASLLNGDVSAGDIDAIIAQSADRNSREGITGILAIEDGKVCQILEGPKEAVNALYARIELDQRHAGVVILDRCTMPERAFAEWSMTRRPMFDVVMIALHKR